ncbi:hypothetical protein HPB47_014132 [Ixodes persulcatus]|uniref:Uncharacterized protein n=1 Tax=Ixodes persulcatus TaxID=34615 RepID=A0AC60QXM3_IXOPE|nr:hypothetical protein HPB47_014132 [Ixodes persulcatus]
MEVVPPSRDPICCLSGLAPGGQPKLIFQGGAGQQVLSSLYKGKGRGDRGWGGFVTEETNMERAILARATDYQRHSSVAAPPTSGLDHGFSLTGIREITRDD